jgi:hypothetical protein
LRVACNVIWNYRNAYPFLVEKYIFQFADGVYMYIAVNNNQRIQ